MATGRSSVIRKGCPHTFGCIVMCIFKIDSCCQVSERDGKKQNAKKVDNTNGTNGRTCGRMATDKNLVGYRIAC